MQCNFLTDILRLGSFVLCLKCTKITAVSWMLEPSGEVGGDVPEYLSLG